MLGAKPRQKTKNKTLFLILGYLIAALFGCLGSYLVFLCLWSLYGVPHLMFSLLAISSGGIISFILAIFLLGKIFDKQYFD
ncbi:hypothetical protein [Lysinibacillus fusiformis]|uniref:Uncharacterized protein n=1 Tax=Lysinibacillus fusiformis TaxID=28031 RepID=A0A1H9SGV8_9BACI|nr:hypothetical protein [Lysinibacillus fusiformis]SCY83828.1 hypothetical protein SAMN02787081_04696 [Lysinibacillus fusiformis]SEO53508.1 hypothetical protein SAMN02787103_04669 [Lysinibacillus fusiformis]SER83459.1 hypothetical protein SAMN02787113_04701 [Lysinibacillus fusiformis]